MSDLRMWMFARGLIFAIVMTAACGRVPMDRTPPAAVESGGATAVVADAAIDTVGRFFVVRAVPVRARAARCALADFDGDGDLDVLVATDGGVRVFAPDGQPDLFLENDGAGQLR